MFTLQVPVNALFLPPRNPFGHYGLNRTKYKKDESINYTHNRNPCPTDDTFSGERLTASVVLWPAMNEATC